MPFAKQPRTQVHTLVLALCVAACLTCALWPRPEPELRPEEDAALLVRGVLTHLLGLDMERPPAR